MDSTPMIVYCLEFSRAGGGFVVNRPRRANSIEKIKPIAAIVNYRWRTSLVDALGRNRGTIAMGGVFVVALVAWNSDRSVLIILMMFGLEYLI